MPNTFVISIVATKGGVGKTTLAANIAGLLADLKFKVLAVDADMQPSLSKYYRLRSTPRTGLAEVISRGGMIQSSDILETQIEGLDLLVSNMSDATQSWLKEREDRLIMLKRAVRQPIVRDKYDFVIIDTQGAKGEADVNGITRYRRTHAIPEDSPLLQSRSVFGRSFRIRPQEQRRSRVLPS